MNDFFYRYPPLWEGILVKRYQRFLADVELANGEVVTTHCANTGPMLGVCTPGARVQLSKSDNPKRKLAYTWEMIQVDGTWVGINTNLPNRVIKDAILNHKLSAEIGEEYKAVKSEVVYGKEKKSKIDLLLTGGDKDIYVEVKNTTLSEGTVALFPDTVTTRGQKHLQELMAIVPTHTAIMLYFINRGDCHKFSPGDLYDPLYGQLFREAISKGVRVLPCRFEITPEGISYLGLAPLSFV